MTDADPSPNTPPNAAEASLRADKWLWYARFFKSRSLAAALCRAGKLRVSGGKVAKANHQVRVGDVLTFPQGRGIRVVRVLALGERRGPAPEAQTLYEDLEPPQPQRSEAAEAVPPGAGRAKGAGRPTKRDRRQIDRLHTADDGGD